MHCGVGLREREVSSAPEGAHLATGGEATVTSGIGIQFYRTDRGVILHPGEFNKSCQLLWYIRSELG